MRQRVQRRVLRRCVVGGELGASEDEALLTPFLVFGALFVVLLLVWDR